MNTLGLILLAALVSYTSAELKAAENGSTGYTIGIGDVLVVTVYEHPDLETRTRVSGSGKINFPLLGVIEVRGRTERDLERRISYELAARSLVNSAQVNVLIEDHVSNRVAILGQVRSPGLHSLDYGSSLLELLAAAIEEGMN